MITLDQIRHIAKELKTNEITAFREYLQYLFLAMIYSSPDSSGVFFKGGTAIHIIYGAPRFSEDLDFTVNIPEAKFLRLIQSLFLRLTQTERLNFKEKQTITGKRYTLNTTQIPQLPPAYINLDFSFREKILEPQKTIIQTTLPVLFTSYVYHLSKPEIYAEKIRAILTRKKGRDMYDLWYLKTLGVNINESLITSKLAYYKLSGVTNQDIAKRIALFSKQDFINDIRPFIPIPQREKLPEFYEYIQTYLQQQVAPSDV